MCRGNPASCFCDSDCYLYGDCCNDIEVSCLQTQSEGILVMFSHALIALCVHLKPTDNNAFILLANIFYIHRLSTDGGRNRTLISSSQNIAAIDYDYRLVCLMPEAVEPRERDVAVWLYVEKKCIHHVSATVVLTPDPTFCEERVLDGNIMLPVFCIMMH